MGLSDHAFPVSSQRFLSRLFSQELVLLQVTLFHLDLHGWRRHQLVTQVCTGLNLPVSDSRTILHTLSRTVIPGWRLRTGLICCWHATPAVCQHKDTGASPDKNCHRYQRLCCFRCYRMEWLNPGISNAVLLSTKLCAKTKETPVYQLLRAHLMIFCLALYECTRYCYSYILSRPRPDFMESSPSSSLFNMTVLMMMMFDICLLVSTQKLVLCVCCVLNKQIRIVGAICVCLICKVSPTKQPVSDVFDCLDIRLDL